MPYFIDTVLNILIFYRSKDLEVKKIVFISIFTKTNNKLTTYHNGIFNELRFTNMTFFLCHIRTNVIIIILRYF